MFNPHLHYIVLIVHGVYVDISILEPQARAWAQPRFSQVRILRLFFLTSHSHCCQMSTAIPYFPF